MIRPLCVVSKHFFLNKKSFSKLAHIFHSCELGPRSVIYLISFSFPEHLANSNIL